MPAHFVPKVRHRRMTIEEEREAFARFHAGDRGALSDILEANMGFLKKVAVSYLGHGMPLEDLISEGSIGMIKAAYRYEVAREFKFISYAVWWVRQAMLKALAEQSRVITMSQEQMAVITHAGAARRRIEQREGREASTEEVQAELDKESNARMGEIFAKHPTIEAAHHITPIDTAPHEGALEWDKAPDAFLERREQAGFIRVLMEECDDRDRDIILGYFGFKGYAETFQDLANRHQISRQRVDQILKKFKKRAAQRGRAIIARAAREARQ